MDEEQLESILNDYNDFSVPDELGYYSLLHTIGLFPKLSYLEFTPVYDYMETNELSIFKLDFILDSLYYDFPYDVLKGYVEHIKTNLGTKIVYDMTYNKLSLSYNSINNSPFSLNDIPFATFNIWNNDLSLSLLRDSKYNDNIIYLSRLFFDDLNININYFGL